MTQKGNGPGISANPQGSGGGAPTISATKSPKGSMMPAFVGVAGVVVAGALYMMSGDDYMYDPNMSNHVPGTEIGTDTNNLGQMSIKREGNGAGAKYALEVVYNIPEGVAPEDARFPLPTEAQIQALLDKIPELSTPDQIDKIYGHTPYIEGTEGLARFEMGRYFGAGYVNYKDQLYDTGYGDYNSDYDKARSEVEAFIPLAEAKGYQALSCSYDLGDHATKDSAESKKFAMHWYKARPTEAGTHEENLETIGRKYEGFWQHDEKDQKHPFLEIRYPRTDCPVNYQRVTDPYKPK